jgi:hypothetical protein
MINDEKSLSSPLPRSSCQGIGYRGMHLSPYSENTYLSEHKASIWFDRLIKITYLAGLPLIDFLKRKRWGYVVHIIVKERKFCLAHFFVTFFSSLYVPKKVCLRNRLSASPLYVNQGEIGRSELLHETLEVRTKVEHIVFPNLP